MYTINASNVVWEYHFNELGQVYQSAGFVD